MALLKNLEQFKDSRIETKAALLKDLRKLKLLTPAHANAKTAKNSQFGKFESYILHLSPATLAFQYIGSKGSLCPAASNGCKSACLNTAGRGRFTSIQNSRLRKSLYFILFQREFLLHLATEILKLNIKAQRNGKKLVVRLNGTSDVQWETLMLTFQSETAESKSKSIFELFPNVQFYDYTKLINRLTKVATIKNYHVTFSASESNEFLWRRALGMGFNVAMVFDAIPTSYNGTTVINGDSHDFRFLDQGNGVIVGLKAKGKAKHDTSGFVVKSQCKTKAA